MPTPAPTFRDDENQPTGPSKASSQATVALVVALLSIFLFGIVLGPVAVVIGVRSRTEIDESRGHLTGRGRATAAIYVGVAAFVLGVISLIVAIAVA